jgi:branched-chain amino acid transport system permease protein
MITETFLPDLQHLAKDFFPSAVFLHNVLERWHLVLGTLFILVVIFFPKGVIGSVREFIDRRK